MLKTNLLNLLFYPYRNEIWFIWIFNILLGTLLCIVPASGLCSMTKLLGGNVKT